MSNPLLDILNIPRTEEEILEKLKENGYSWSVDQLKLYAELDHDVVSRDGKYYLENISRAAVILREIDRIMGSEEIMPIPRIKSDMPQSIITSREEIASIVKNSAEFELLPNNITVKRKPKDN